MSDHSTTRSGAPKLSSFGPTRYSPSKPSGFGLTQQGNLNSTTFTNSPPLNDLPANRKKANIKYSRIKRKILTHVALVRSILVTFALLIILTIAFLAIRLSAKFDIPFYYNIASNFVTAPVSQLASHEGRVNILVMGKGGGDHEAPDLTDTIMLVSVGVTSNDVKIVSIPRDTWIPEMRAKINSAYYWGIQKGVGGIPFAKAEASQIVGLPIQYGAVVDFSGFKEIIDELGGIEVNVTNSFTDNYYPVAGRENDTCGGRDPKFMCRYETLTFKEGLQIMDGATALKFVRSRHADGIEGTDIAREARQGKVMEALKNKLSDKNTYLNISKDISLVKVVLRSIQTDVDYPTAAILARKVYDARDNIKSYLIPENLLVNVEGSTLYDKQSVFIPKAGNGKWKDINNWVLTTLKTTN